MDAGQRDVVLVVARGKTRLLRLENHVAPLDRPFFPHTVVLTPYGRPEDQRTFRVERDGTVEAMGLEDGVAYVLWGEYRDSRARYVHATDVRAAPEPLTVGIEEGGTIRCIVRAPEGVHVLGVFLQGMGVSKRHVPVSMLEGVFRIVGVPPGTWTVAAYGRKDPSAPLDAKDYWQAETTASAGDEIELQLKCHAPR